MNTEWYQKMCDRAQKLLKNELSYGFVSTIIWEVAKKGVNEINFDRILEISSKIIESAPRELSKEERGDLLYTISEFDKEIEAKVALLSADADRGVKPLPIVKTKIRLF